MIFCLKRSRCANALCGLKLTFFFLVVTYLSFFSAGPILHLWVAERFCEIYGIQDAETVKQIIIGTEFPDIRYITHESRTLTHPIVLNLQEVFQSTTPFEAGMKLHWSYLLPEIKQKPIFQRHLHLMLNHIEKELRQQSLPIFSFSKG